MNDLPDIDDLLDDPIVARLRGALDELTEGIADAAPLAAPDGLAADDVDVAPVTAIASARRRTWIVPVAAAAAVVAVVAGIAIITVRDDPTTPAGPSPSTVSTTPAPTSTTSTTATTAPPPVRTYTLTGVPGLDAVGDPITQTYAGGEGDGIRSIWTRVTGPQNGVIAVADSSDMGLPPGQIDGDVAVTPVERGDTTLYLAIANGLDGAQPTEPTAADAIVYIWQPDDRLWSVSGYGMSVDELVDLAAAIQPGSGLPHVLPVDGWETAGFSVTSDLEVTSQTFTLDGANISLAVTSGGLSSQLAGGVTDIEPSTVDSSPGYLVTSANGQVSAIWFIGGADDLWGSLTVQAALADRIDDLVAAITAH